MSEPFGEGVQSIEDPPKPFWKKLLVVYGIFLALAALCAFIVGAIWLGFYVGGMVGGHDARTVGGCVAIVLLFGLALASADWSDDGCY